MTTNPPPGVYFQPSRAGIAVVEAEKKKEEAEKKKKSAKEVDKMLDNLRARPHRTMDVDKLLDKLKRQRLEKEKKEKAQHGRLSMNDDFTVEREVDGETVTDARSLWKKAVQGGGENELFKAIAAMKALSEVELPDGESSSLGIDRDLLNGLAQNKVRSVNLTCCDPPLTDNSITVLGYAVMKSTSVVTLNIGGSTITPEGCRELGHMLSGNSSLQTLDCTDCGITDEGAIELGRTLYLNRSIRHLNLGFNRIGHIAVAIISQSLRMGTNVRTLDLSHNPLGDKGAEILAQTIVDAMDRKTQPWQLRVLHLNNCGIRDSGAAALAAALRRCKSIEKLHVNANPISVEGAIELSLAAGSHEEVTPSGSGSGSEGGVTVGGKSNLMKSAGMSIMMMAKSRVEIASGMGNPVPVLVAEEAEEIVAEEDIITVESIHEREMKEKQLESDAVAEEEVEKELGEEDGSGGGLGGGGGGGGDGGLAPLVEEDEEEEEEDDDDYY